jgi:hypothetical protein
VIVSARRGISRPETAQTAASSQAASSKISRLFTSNGTTAKDVLTLDPVGAFWDSEDDHLKVGHVRQRDPAEGLEQRDARRDLPTQLRFATPVASKRLANSEPT